MKYDYMIAAACIFHLPLHYAMYFMHEYNMQFTFYGYVQKKKKKKTDLRTFHHHHQSHVVYKA